jgi:phosphoribosyl-AMP cyclohydrolase
MGTKILLPNFAKRGGLVTVVAQDIRTKEVLMVASTDEAGFLETLQTGIAVYFSTSRNKRWMKGETSGDLQLVRQILVDCDGDAIIYLVEQKGDGACHTKARSCFYRTVFAQQSNIIFAPQAGEKDKLQVVETNVCPAILGV